MAGLKGIINVNYEQLGPVWPFGIHNRQNPDYTEFFKMNLLKKCMGLKFTDGMGKSPENSESGLDKFYCIFETFKEMRDCFLLKAISFKYLNN